jgi:hypothetical protein
MNSSTQITGINIRIERIRITKEAPLLEPPAMAPSHQVFREPKRERVIMAPPLKIFDASGPIASEGVTSEPPDKRNARLTSNNIRKTKAVTGSATIKNLKNLTKALTNQMTSEKNALSAKSRAPAIVLTIIERSEIINLPQQKTNAYTILYEKT